MSVLLEVDGLTKTFDGPSGAVRAVDDVSFTVAAGETFGLVGRSGSGKSTVARLVLRLVDADEGSVSLDGQELTGLRRRALRRARRRMAIVFQDPASSLDPRLSVRAAIAEPLRIARAPRKRERVDELLGFVGLDVEHGTQYPHELSGGQRQRVAIARALALEPALVVLDEPVTALDSSIQAQVLNLLTDLQTRLGVAYLFVGHDLAVVRHVADRIAVMHEGRIVETAATDTLFTAPEHPVTQALLASTPSSHPPPPPPPPRFGVAE